MKWRSMKSTSAYTTSIILSLLPCKVPFFFCILFFLEDRLTSCSRHGPGRYKNLMDRGQLPEFRMRSRATVNGQLISSTRFLLH
jgi:hypothetical protein